MFYLQLIMRKTAFNHVTCVRNKLSVLRLFDECRICTNCCKVDEFKKGLDTPFYYMHINFWPKLFINIKRTALLPDSITVFHIALERHLNCTSEYKRQI